MNLHSILQRADEKIVDNMESPCTRAILRIRGTGARLFYVGARSYPRSSRFLAVYKAFIIDIINLYLGAREQRLDPWHTRSPSVFLATPPTLHRSALPNWDESSHTCLSVEEPNLFA